jgi:hypothetical protein
VGDAATEHSLDKAGFRSERSKQSSSLAALE